MFPANQAPADLDAATLTFVAPAIAADAVQNATHLAHAAEKLMGNPRMGNPLLTMSLPQPSYSSMPFRVSMLVLLMVLLRECLLGGYGCKQPSEKLKQL